MVVKREPGTRRVRNLCSKRTTKQSSSTYCNTFPHALNYCLYRGGIYCKVKEAKWLSKLAMQPTHTHRHKLSSSKTALTVAFTRPFEVWALNNTYPYTQRWGKYLYHSGLWWHLGVWQCWDDLQIPAGKKIMFSIGNSRKPSLARNFYCWVNTGEQPGEDFNSGYASMCSSRVHRVPCECRSANSATGRWCRRAKMEIFSGTNLLKKGVTGCVLMEGKKTYLEEHDFPEGPLKYERK